MVKKSKEDIKQDEQLILKELLINARKSAHEIAKKHGFSRQKVWRIIKDLETDNTIWGYSAVVNESAMNKNVFFALSKAKANFSSKINDIVEKFKNKKIYCKDIDIIGSFYINGSYDWITVFSAKNVRDAKRYINYINQEYADYVETVELLESVFPLIKCGKINPEIHKLKEFA